MCVCVLWDFLKSEQMQDRALESSALVLVCFNSFELINLFDTQMDAQSHRVEFKWFCCAIII